METVHRWDLPNNLQVNSLQELSDSIKLVLQNMDCFSGDHSNETSLSTSNYDRLYGKGAFHMMYKTIIDQSDQPVYLQIAWLETERKFKIFIVWQGQH